MSFEFNQSVFKTNPLAFPVLILTADEKETFSSALLKHPNAAQGAVDASKAVSYETYAAAAAMKTRQWFVLSSSGFSMKTAFSVSKILF